MARESFFSVKYIFKDRRKLTVFLICVGLSLLSWVMISLGKSYNTTIIVPVRYSNFPENKTLLNSVPDYLAVNVEGTGYDLLQYDDRLEKDTLVINLDNLKISVLGDYQRGYLDPAILGKSLQNRLNGALAINRVLSDSIEFLFDLKVSRVIAVKPVVNYKIAQGHTILDSISSDPSEVEVYGPLSVLDTLRFIPTEVIEAGEMMEAKEYRVTLNYHKLGNDAMAVPDSVSVSIPVDKLTEKRFMIIPDQHNVPDSLEMLVFPNAVEVTAHVPMSHYNDIGIEDFVLTIDYSQLHDGYKVLPVTLAEWPVIARNVSLKPKNVEIVLSRRD
ncbi:MAG: YbbR-like domain-containing protein [Flavobacteriales bacterium]